MNKVLKSSPKIAHHGDYSKTSSVQVLPLHASAISIEESPHKNICVCVGIVCIGKILVCLSFAAIIFYALGGTLPSSASSTPIYYQTALPSSLMPTSYNSVSPSSSPSYYETALKLAEDHPPLT